MSNLKILLYVAAGAIVVYFAFFSDSGDSSDVGYESEVVTTPTEGIVTTVKEVEADLFKIEDEATVASPEDSRIIAKYLSGSVDTFTLAEAHLVDAGQMSPSDDRQRSVFSAASMGFFGYMMGRNMAMSPSPAAYMDQKTYNRVSSSAGRSVVSTASRSVVSRPSGSSGYGSGRSTRSVGG